MMFFLTWFRRENTKDVKYWGKKSTRTHKYLSSWFGRKSGKKREKSGVSTWITYLPLWCVICKFSLFFILFYFIMGTCVLVSQVLDSLSFLPFFFFNSFLLCSCNTLSFFNCLGFFFFFEKKSFGFLNFLSSFYFYFLMKKSFIHIFFNKNIMYYFCFI